MPDWLDELNEAIAADPETWGELVLQGAKAAGVSMTALREAVVAGAEACDILEADDEPDPRRLELYREIATGGLDLVHRLAMIGAGVAIPERREPCHA